MISKFGCLFSKLFSEPGTSYVEWHQREHRKGTYECCSPKNIKNHLREEGTATGTIVALLFKAGLNGLHAHHNEATCELVCEADDTVDESSRVAVLADQLCCCAKAVKYQGY